MSLNDAQIISEIEKVRAKNNKCWMDILRLAFKNDKDEAKMIFKHITKNDAKINRLSKELSEWKI